MDLSSIRKRIDQIEKFVEENKINSEMLKAELQNDDLYRQAEETVKTATKRKKEVKEEILNIKENAEIIENIKENQEEIKTLKDILSEELMQYYNKTNTDEITDSSGNVRKFKLSARITQKAK